MIIGEEGLRATLVMKHVTIGRVEDAKRHMMDHQKVTTIMGKKFVIVGVAHELVRGPSMFEPALYNVNVELKEVGCAG